MHNKSIFNGWDDDIIIKDLKLELPCFKDSNSKMKPKESYSKIIESLIKKKLIKQLEINYFFISFSSFKNCLHFNLLFYCYLFYIL